MALKKLKKQNVDVKESILKAFIQLVYETGIESITLQKVATKAGVAFGSVRYYFADKPVSLTEAAIMYMYESLYTVIENKRNDSLGKNINPIYLYVDTMFDWMEKSPAQANMMMYFWFLCTGNKKTNLVNDTYLEKAQLRIKSYIHEAIGMGYYKPIEDSFSIAVQIHASIMGCGIGAITTKQNNYYKNTCKSIIAEILKSYSQNETASRSPKG